jgi:hypothetical protein
MNIGGRLLNNDTIVKIGLDLVDSCWNTYASTAYVSSLPVSGTYDSLPSPIEQESVRRLSPSHLRMVPTLATLPLQLVN